MSRYKTATDYMEAATHPDELELVEQSFIGWCKQIEQVDIWNKAFPSGCDFLRWSALVVNGIYELKFQNAVMILCVETPTSF